LCKNETHYIFGGAINFFVTYYGKNICVEA